VRDQLARAARAAADLARLDPTTQDLSDRLSGLEAEADDIALELGRRTESFGEAAFDAQATEARLGTLYGLLRKYGESEAELLDHAAEARAEAARLRSVDRERERRSNEARLLEARASDAARDLHDARASVAQRLSGAVTEQLVELGFPSASFAVSVDPSPLDETGNDSVAFLLAPNPGEPARALARIASGGEMSRVALALKTVLARADATPTLIFDEVDAGIGGRSADPVGLLLWRLARDHQVICVTHLPQIAAYAEHHLRIEKVDRDGRTVTEVSQLDADERRHELAQMLGGSAGADAALATASELLSLAATNQQAAMEPEPR
jgi:DNA repair protein RecN (Recombination protein N)